MKKLSWFLIMAFMAFSCNLANDEELNSSIAIESMASASVTPTVVVGAANNGGNVTCAEAVPGTKFELSTVGGTGGNDYLKLDDFAYPWDKGFTVTVKDGIYVSWSFTAPKGFCLVDMAVIVKGGPTANVYYYSGGTITGDAGLTAPINPKDERDGGGKPYGLSNLRFCYNLVPCGEPNCTGETAFGGETSGSGNAWWFAYDVAVGGQQAIYAGQKAVDGAYVEVVNDVISINLGPNMQLNDVTCTDKLNKKGVMVTVCDTEQVKIQGYSSLPTERPAAGLFTLYKGIDLIVQGNGSSYYIIHLDVEVCE